MKPSQVLTASLYGIALLAGPSSRGDAVTEWSAYLDEAVFATAQPVPAQPRTAAIVHLAMFEAVNGLERRYMPYHVTETGPRAARADAAAVQAAYAAMRALFPTQAEVLDARLEESLARIPGANGKSRAIARGRAWGQYVAERILALRRTDRWGELPPAFMGGFELGQWRSIATGPNADGALPAVFPQLAVLTPFVMESPSQFRPGPPYGLGIPDALRTGRYAADLEEVRVLGRSDSPVRTAEQADIARLWQVMGPVDENRAARSVISPRASLLDNARLFALLNMVACDALIIGWDSKFAYELWRPHHAIRLADNDGNPDTNADPAWTGLILAPRFPEYVSNHSTLTAAMMRVLARELGDRHRFTLGSPLMPGTTQSYGRFTEAAAQVKEARIWGGIHFRHACEVGNELGVALADYALAHYLAPLASCDR